MPPCVQLKAFKSLVRRVLHSKEAGLDMFPSAEALKRMVEQQPRLMEHLAEPGVDRPAWDKVCRTHDTMPLPHPAAFDDANLHSIVSCLSFART